MLKMQKKMEVRRKANRRQQACSVCSGVARHSLLHARSPVAQHWNSKLCKVLPGPTPTRIEGQKDRKEQKETPQEADAKAAGKLLKQPDEETARAAFLVSELKVCVCVQCILYIYIYI